MEIENLQDEKEEMTKKAQWEIAEKNKSILEKDSLIVTQKGKMDKLFAYFPILNEYDFIMRLCEVVKIPANIRKQLFSGKAVSYTGKLYSPEHKQEFDAENLKISIAKNTKDNKPFLAFADIDYGNWFRDQKNKMLEKMEIKILV